MTRVWSRGEDFGIGFMVRRSGTDDYNMMRAGVGHAPHRFPPFRKTGERMGHPQWGEAKKDQIPRLRLVMTNRRRDDKQRKRDGDGREAKKEQIPHFVRDDKRKRGRARGMANVGRARVIAARRESRSLGCAS